MIDIIYFVKSHYETQSIIGLVALILAYWAYRKSRVDEYRGWLDLSRSFQYELAYARDWIGNHYHGEIKSDWTDPGRFIYPLTAEASKAMLRKGHPPIGLFPEGFFDELAKYNERIETFNHFLNFQGINYATSGIESKKYNGEERANHINNIVHNYLIGNQWTHDLHRLFTYFDRELREIEKNKLSKLSWYFKYPVQVTIGAVIAYLILDYFLK